MGKQQQVMGSIDLQGMKPGDLVEYQCLSYASTACGTFQGWHPTDDGQRLVVRHQQMGMDILVDPERVMLITRQSEDTP